MAQDFRDLLVEQERNGTERWFEDVKIGDRYLFSVQASSCHASTPEDLLDDVRDYTAFDVSIQSTKGVISYGRYASWDEFKDTDWAKRFDVKELPFLAQGEYVPTADVQACYEALLAYAEANPFGTE